MPAIVQNANSPYERICELKQGRNTIGRGLDNSIVVEDEARSLSRHHAEIWMRNGETTVCDLGSSNGTFLNDVPLLAQKSHQIKEGDRVRFGSVVFVYRSQPKPRVSPSGGSLNFVNSEVSIIMSVAPELSRVRISEVVHPGRDTAAGGSVLMLQNRDAAQRNADKLKILLEISKELSSPESYHLLPEKILDLLFQVMRVDRAILLLVNETTQQLESKAVKVRDSVAVDYEFYSKRIVEYVKHNGCGILTDNAAVDQRFAQSHSILQQSIQAAMCVPLKPRDRVIGVLYVDNLSMSHIYEKEDLEFLTSLANQAAIAIENANLTRKMQSEVVRRARLERFFPQELTQRLQEEWNLNEIMETEVTALFSDISGFTTLASQMPPRQVLELLNEYFRVMVEETVFRYGGVLEKYIADALLAVWGSPYRRENDANQAVSAAIAMQWAMNRLNQQWQQQGRNQHIQIHIGLNTGVVAAGNIGSEQLIQFTHIGDTMNVASRICNLAKAGEIVISDTTLACVASMGLPVQPLPPSLVKGKDQPLQTYRVLWQQLQG
ncbi:MAG: FHA domain-containing protein [Oscillatoriales cyanobacterium SM2_2_1]|nr:FHA domain-containing protein [Oscillatoriales cyanobacterium SM2_2_1]